MNEVTENLQIDTSQFYNVPESDIDALVKSALINIDEEPPIAPILLWLIMNQQLYSIASLGNISTIIGKPKAKKSFLLLLLIGAILSKNQSAIKSGKFKNKIRIILFDTEQSLNKVHQNAKKIIRLSGNNSDFILEVYCLRSKSVEERISIIQHVLYKYDDILFVAIDGFRDIIYDFNDPKESREVVGLLMKWSEEKNIHIATVLHQNKGDNNAKGHAGSELTAKSETVISVAKDIKNPNTSIISAEYTREIEFPQFAIGIDENSLPFFLDDWAASESFDGKKKIFSPFDYPETTHLIVLKQVFEGGKKLKRSELLGGIKVALQSLSVNCGDNKVKDLVTYYTNIKKWIIKEGADRSPHAVYCFNPLGDSLG